MDMKKKTLFATVGAGLSLALAAVALGGFLGNQKAVAEVGATTTTVASFSRSGTTDTVTGGTLTATSLSGKTGYYQDTGTAGTSVCTLQVLNTSALFSTAPAGSIDITAKLGGGTKKASGVGLMAALLDKNGDLLGDAVTITDAITVTTGSDFTAHFGTANYASVYGFKLYHTKIASWNVRYYTASLGGNDTFTSYLTIGSEPTKTTYAVGDTLDLTGLVVNKYTGPSTFAATTAFTTTPASGSTIAATTGTTVTVTSTETGVTGTSFSIVLKLTPTQAIAAVAGASLTTGNNLAGNYIVEGTVKTVTDSTNHRFVVTDGTKDVYAYGYSSVSVTDLCVGGSISVYCTLGAYTNTYSTDSLTELSSITIQSNVNPAETFANWMMSADRDAQTCSAKWAEAKTKYTALVADQQTLFKSGSSVEVIVNARARYNAWAAANGESVSASNVSEMNNSTAMIAVAIVTVLGLLTLAGVVVLKKKHN
jgi:hypothetical protein